jgi:Na+/H+ antiporter NhaD/arsenite permease-like protein
VATAIFVAAIAHTFAAKRFLVLAHAVRRRHDERERAAGRPPSPSIGAELLHFVGEIEVIFGVWAIVLMAAMSWFYGWSAAKDYLARTVDYTEPLFVFVIMTIAATRPIVTLAERLLGRVARFGGDTPAAWWLSIIVLGPLLGSFITEPAAMTLCALLLGRRVYGLGPSRRLAYATLGLLFVNVSAGGTLTHFAAPPVLMVARAWNWDTWFILTRLGWRAVVGIALATAVYFVVLRRDLAALGKRREQARREPTPPVPPWIVAVHVGFLVWTVINSHYPPLFLGGFLFLLGFVKATEAHQSPVDVVPPLLVGFFLAGLVIQGGLQGWWIAPVLGSLGVVPLFVGAVVLTAFNDNALITYLATLVPGLAPGLKAAVVAGAVTGGGLTVIANAPNPAGQSILARYFEDGISPLGLAAGAAIPTVIVGSAFLLL